jgi:hypothetical protein
MEEKAVEATFRAMDRGFNISPFLNDATREATFQDCVTAHRRRRAATMAIAKPPEIIQD